MAENKKSFLLYTNLTATVKKIIEKDRINNTNNAGELFYHILQYVSDENPEPISDTIEFVFEPIKNQLKDDLKKYEISKVDKSNGGKLGNLKRWNVDLYDKVIAGKMELVDAEIIALNRRASHTDTNQSHPIASVAVNVNDNVNVITTVNNIITADEAISICLNDENWKSEIERIYKVDRMKVQFALAEFKSHCITRKKDEPRTIGKFCEHFTNWVRVKKQYQKTG